MDTDASPGLKADLEDGRIVIRDARTGQKLPRYKSRGEAGWDGERIAAEKALPYGSPVLAEIPVEFWSHDWLMGMRTRTYLGHLCSHAGGGTCIQPERQSQAEGMQPPCIPFEPVQAKITVLSGKLSDYR